MQKRTDMDAIRSRLVDRMREKKMEGDYAALADVTKDDRAWVRRIVVGEIETIPADYIGRLEEAGFVSARWLVAARLPMDVQPDDEQVTPATRLLLIKILLGDESNEQVRELIKEARRILGEPEGGE